MSITPATTTTHGPRRKVVSVDPEGYLHGNGNRYPLEVLECGHHGEVLMSPHARPRKWRYCWPCMTPEQRKDACRALSIRDITR